MTPILILWPANEHGVGFKMAEYIDWHKSFGAQQVTLALWDRPDWPADADRARQAREAGLGVTLLANTATRSHDGEPGLLTKGEPLGDTPYHIGWTYDEATRRQAICPAYRGARLTTSVRLLQDACALVKPDLLWLHWELFPPKYILDVTHPGMVESCSRCGTQAKYLANRASFVRAVELGLPLGQKYMMYHNNYWWPQGAGSTYREMVSLHNMQADAFALACDYGPAWLKPVDGWPANGVTNRIVCLTDVVDAPTPASEANAYTAGLKGAGGLFMDGPSFSTAGTNKDILLTTVPAAWTAFLAGRKAGGWR